jgi:hypothetical protein
VTSSGCFGTRSDGNAKKFLVGLGDELDLPDLALSATFAEEIDYSSNIVESSPECSGAQIFISPPLP